MAGNSQAGAFQPWMTARQAVAPAGPDADPAAPPTLFQFSAACWYFAEALTLKMKEARVDMSQLRHCFEVIPDAFASSAPPRTWDVRYLVPVLIRC